MDACGAPGDESAMDAGPLRTYSPMVPRLHKDRAHLLLLALLVALGAWLRLRGLTTFGLWFDEWITVEQSTRHTLLEAITASGTHPPLLRLLVRASVALLPSSQDPAALDLAVRLPSALLGVASIPFVFLFARRWAGGSGAVGLAAAGLLALSPYGIYYAQEARYYAGMVLFAAWALHGLALLLDRPRSPWRHAYLAAPLTLGLLNHHLFGMLFLLTFAVAAPQILRDLRHRWFLASPWVVSGLLILPWFWFVVRHLDPQARPWLADLPTQWHDTGVAFFTGRIGAFHLTGASKGPGFYRPLSQACWLLLGAGMTVHLVRRWSSASWRSALIVGLGLAAAAAAHATGETAKFFHHKYLAFIFPFVCLSLGELLVLVAHPPVSWRAFWSDLGHREAKSHARAPREPEGPGGPARWRALGVTLWMAALAVTMLAGQRVLPVTVEAFERIRPGSRAPFVKEPYRETARWVQQRRSDNVAVVVFDPFSRRNNIALLEHYGLARPILAYRWHHLRHPVSFWAGFSGELDRAKEVLVITAHCSPRQRLRVEQTLSWGFPRRVQTRRLLGAEGSIQIAILARPGTSSARSCGPGGGAGAVGPCSPAARVLKRSAAAAW